ncbi:uncharacterized protein L3040_007163 [Drepanopeziza brunnea f. sp. 'multigermtubi']|uniref:Uncharacterized protein n=1 Tax=Marssonina brunnea f. sp. multigermtubi (strain MB_m1) TaxID=1072389 RepID=K1W7L4_MARBU|nr:uncharacterized protein MBM_08842 [Drepanopeziza brunnea f. sp. 'multigermtubi' MB_m1]EKD13080.1 hypothetical protein MBM_08842 [Drepanopeziza brunnea f. sp. 'multigermtubi' MB_m1]KAJ5038297.1 hypothetical protein L3040_007163 [Drepanopeziza brunnea f. sp. 'multigermtubi']
MASTSRFADKAISVVVQGDAYIRSSKIPAVLRFPLVVVLSLMLSSLLYSFTPDYMKADLGRVSRSRQEWWEVWALVLFRTFELALGWFGNYDGYDLASLSLLSHGPPLYLLGSFYHVASTTVASSLVIDALTTYIPFRILRPLSLAHSASSSKYSVPVPNADIVTSYEIQALTTGLVALIYAVTVYTSYATFLPVYLATYFEGIPSMTAAYASSFVAILPTTLVLGVAARSFIFTPAVTFAPSSRDAKNAAFNPETATLADTFWHNVWGFSARTKVVIKRTATVMLVTGLNTFVQTFVTVEGVEVMGAVVYSGVWVAAAGLTGVALGLVSAV